MNRGRVKIKRKRLGDLTIFTSSQRTPRVTIRSTITSNKSKSRHSNARAQGQVKKSEIVRGLRSDSKRTRLSNRRTGRQQQSTRSMDNRNKVSGSQNRLKLFTKDFDARRRIDAKRQKGKEDGASKVKANSKMVLEQSREQEANANLSKKRGFSMIGNQLKIVSKIETEKERETTFTGSSLRVTTLQTSPERLQHRETSSSGNSLLIKTENRRSDAIESEPETTEYGLFEARRKAQQAARGHVEPEYPKLSSLNPISRPRRPPPVYEYEDAPSLHQGNSSKLLVSNLHPNVSQDDIYELFSAIGPIKSARMVRRGVAEIVYNTQQDAANAHKKYHTRNLDGQPMLCRLAASEQPFYSPPSARHPRGSATPSSSTPVVFTVKI